MKKTLLLSTLAFATAVSAQAMVLINFHGSDLDGAYNPSGTTFNNISYGIDSVNPADAFATVTNVALLDDTGASAGIALSTETTSAGGFINAGASETVFNDAKPATGFEWYDASAASLRNVAVASGTGTFTYTFSGFNTTDQVTFQFVLGRDGTGTRRIDFGVSGNSTSLLDGVNTASVAYFLETATLTGATSYTFVATRGDPADSASSFVGAASITVVPEPSTFAFIGGALALGLVMVRRRRLRK